VETAEQCQWLRAAGCEWIQGFVIARPLTAQAATDFPLISAALQPVRV
jgi:EAL domain-containing protein (putative c-di-GMP-specific phosphodiesterase class I)